LIQRIIRLAGFQREDMVLEIGTGKGHLTEALCQKAGKVCSVEIDRGLMENAKKRLSEYDNVELVLGDFMQYRLPEKEAYQVFANIPFFLTTQIVEKLALGKNPPTDIWLVMEKGAAKRFMGLPKETKKSLELKVFWEMEIVYRFRREDFHPKPSVDCVLVHFKKKAVPDLDRREYREFQKFIECAMRTALRFTSNGYACFDVIRDSDKRKKTVDKFRWYNKMVRVWERMPKEGNRTALCRLNIGAAVCAAGKGWIVKWQKFTITEKWRQSGRKSGTTRKRFRLRRIIPNRNTMRW